MTIELFDSSGGNGFTLTSGLSVTLVSSGTMINNTNRIVSLPTGRPASDVCILFVRIRQQKMYLIHRATDGQFVVLPVSGGTVFPFDYRIYLVNGVFQNTGFGIQTFTQNGALSFSANHVLPNVYSKFTYTSLPRSSSGGLYEDREPRRAKDGGNPFIFYNHMLYRQHIGTFDGRNGTLTADTSFFIDDAGTYRVISGIAVSLPGDTTSRPQLGHRVRTIFFIE